MKTLAAILVGQLVAQLGWIDPLFVPLVLVGPPVTGAVAAARRVPLRLVALMWASAGVGMAWSDYVLNHEDVAFHLVLAVVMAALSAAGYGVVSLALRRRTTVAP